jgi:hypothetical protein
MLFHPNSIGQVVEDNDMTNARQPDGVIIHHLPQQLSLVANSRRDDETASLASEQEEEAVHEARFASARRDYIGCIAALAPLAHRGKSRWRREAMETFLATTAAMLRGSRRRRSVTAVDCEGPRVHLPLFVDGEASSSALCAAWITQPDVLTMLGVKDAALRTAASNDKKKRVDGNKSLVALDVSSALALLRTAAGCSQSLQWCRIAAVLSVCGEGPADWLAAVDHLVRGLQKQPRCAVTWRTLSDLLRVLHLRLQQRADDDTTAADDCALSRYIDEAIVRCLQLRDRPSVVRSAALRTQASDFPMPRWIHPAGAPGATENDDGASDGACVMPAFMPPAAGQEANAPCGDGCDTFLFHWAIPGTGEAEIARTRDLLAVIESSAPRQLAKPLPALEDIFPASPRTVDRPGDKAHESAIAAAAYALAVRRRFFTRYTCQHVLAVFGGFHGSVVDDIIGSEVKTPRPS